MSVRTKVGLGFNNYIRENELGWDDSAFSVFTTNSEEVEGRPLFNRFAKADSMKVVPPPLSGDYTPLSDHIDLDESQMSYGIKSSTSGDSNSVSNDFVSCDNSDKSSEVNTNDFASSDSSVKSSEPKSNDSTSCASTSSDLPSFSYNSSDKNENTSRTFCNKNGYFNKKAGHFRKNASSVSKLCFVCGSSTHLIKDCDFYEKQMANKTVGNGVGPVHSRNNVNHQNQFVPQVVLLRTGKVNIPPARPQPVPTGKPKVPAPVPTGRQNRPFPVPTDRGYSPSVTSGQPRLGLWYPRESPFVLEAYSDSDYAGANKDRKSTTGGCQFLGRRLISWQCKKQTIVATSSTEAEYVAAANCCGQKLIQVLKIHTDDNVADLLTKAFDGPSVPLVDSSTKSSGTRRKSHGRNRLTKIKSILKELDLNADDKTFIKVVSDEDSTDEDPILWSALAGWEVISTPLGEINVLYRSDQSTKHFTTLKEILHMVDRQDLLKLYGMVVTYYENHLVAGAGLMLWGDLQVLIHSQEGGKGSFVWNHQSLWQIRSWRLYTLSNVHVLETVSGEVLYMFADVFYPLSVKLIERMLKHKLEIDKDVVVNDMTTAEQLIRFIKNQNAAAQVSPV
ncbi:hypothetical protein Tco_1056838 [Tanacetum coccineum]|uniref:Uncharacterized protein n=1 Tax=Tanacetum coccineum TaxID=301880 RepID=A0ABQ5H4P0_9ASTR